ncbi:hypothetical protein H310_05622 [Aphanomyces invadans]|uniref:Temptin Cys/Cys disulfide domain-containing protein n=1 Tax=Aphanomyces invadans TaxID=157072 RepID=A0A024UC47_9STRA|nr:hypothetical protein H310_05622 [Aphanomyces invadans]ETW03218.1 hypothetical protein H310_05622 [Aphanomyces invadans]|eukprot:XP_008868602.1 hypothetical protein H310_05622 [Aphanomyces invadans]
MKSTLIVLLGVATQVAAYSKYLLLIPNGKNIPGVKTPGHINFTNGGGPRGPFGLAFAAAGHAWTVELCRNDSDGDGATNGEELQDPCCTWNVNVTTPNTTIASHPGLANNFTAADLAALRCKSDTTTAAPTTTPKPSSSVSTGLALVAVAVAAGMQHN